MIEDDSRGEDVTEPPLATDDTVDLTEVDHDRGLVIEAAKTYQNPVAHDRADPGAIGVGSTFYTVCTGGRFARWKSTDLVSWNPDATLFSAADRPTSPWSSVNG